MRDNAVRMIIVISSMVALGRLFMSSSFLSCLASSHVSPGNRYSQQTELGEEGSAWTNLVHVASWEAEVPVTDRSVREGLLSIAIHVVCVYLHVLSAWACVDA